MRARRREVNIFNMSLLDILCGALGAFCFMMLVALPYYIPPGSGLELRKAQNETDRLLKELSNLKERMPDQKSVQEMEELMRQLEAQVKALQGHVNILTAEKEELQTRLAQLNAEKEQLAQQSQALQVQNQNLAQENQNLKTRLQAKKPFTIIARADELGQRLDVILFRPSQMEKNPNPLFQEWANGKFDHMHTVRNAMLYARGIGFTMQEDSPANSEGLLFVRLMDEPEHRKATAVRGAIADDESLVPPIQLPQVTLYPERFWTLLGTVSIDQNSVVHFKAASEAERAAAWNRLTGSAAPATPTATPPPPRADHAAIEATRQTRLELNKKFSRLNQLHPGTPADEAEILALTGELMKELPPNDGMRRAAESIRQRTLEEKSRREKQPSAMPATSP